MIFQEWLQTYAGRMVSFEKMPRMLEIAYNAGAEAAEARATQLEAERDEAAQQRHFWFTRFNEVANERDELRRQLEQAQRTIEAQARRIAELEKYQHDLRVPIVPHHLSRLRTWRFFCLTESQQAGWNHNRHHNIYSIRTLAT